VGLALRITTDSPLGSDGLHPLSLILRRPNFVARATKFGTMLSRVFSDQAERLTANSPLITGLPARRRPRPGFPALQALRNDPSARVCEAASVTLQALAASVNSFDRPLPVAVLTVPSTEARVRCPKTNLSSTAWPLPRPGNELAAFRRCAANKFAPSLDSRPGRRPLL